MAGPMGPSGRMEITTPISITGVGMPNFSSMGGVGGSGGYSNGGPMMGHSAGFDHTGMRNFLAKTYPSVLSSAIQQEEQNYLIKKSNLEKKVTDELIAAKSATGATGNSHEERTRNSFTLMETLILGKESEQKALDAVADSFYGAVFFTKTIDDYLAETFNRALRAMAPGDTINVWNTANKSAYAAKILKDEIALLKSKKDEVQKEMLRDAKRKVGRGILPSAPPSISLENNMQETLKNNLFYPSIGSAHFYTWFYGKVRNGGPWDYKKGQPQYQSFGNFHYGAVGTAGGIPEQVLLRAAGAAQMRAGTSDATFGSFWGDAPYGDDPVDQVWIKAGIDYAKAKGY